MRTVYGSDVRPLGNADIAGYFACELSTPGKADARKGEMHLGDIITQDAADVAWKDDQCHRVSELRRGRRPNTVGSPDASQRGTK